MVRSKGELKTIAYQHLEGVQHILEELHGKYIQNVCWYVGIELVLEEIAPKEAHWLKEFRIAAKDFFTDPMPVCLETLKPSQMKKFNDISDWRIYCITGLVNTFGYEKQHQKTWCF
ncbi:hypothetical protein ACLZX5_03805 [Enterococcus faecium]